MQAESFDELAMYRAVSRSGARALLIGGRAMIAMGIPILTADWDYWIHRDDIARLNGALEPLDLFPSHSPLDAIARGRYVLENGERVDVMVAAGVSTVDGELVEFDGVWSRRKSLRLEEGITVAIPDIDDLIRTKRFGSRPKDAEHIRLLQAAKESGGDP